MQDALKEREVPATSDMLVRVLASVSGAVVLVGGQALGYWVSQYELDSFIERVNAGIRAITDDIDVLGGRSDVEAIAARLKTSPIFPIERGLDALVGQVKVYTDRTAKPPTFVNIDVIHQVVGLSAQSIRRQAITVEIDGVSINVMHPLDVLTSRVENLYWIKDKRNEKGRDQALLAGLVTREYVLEQLLRQGNERLALRAIERVADIAKSSAGRSATRDFGIQFEAYLPLDFVKNRPFREKRLPRLLEELHREGPVDAIPTSPDCERGDDISDYEPHRP